MVLGLHACHIEKLQMYQINHVLGKEQVRGGFNRNVSRIGVGLYA